MYPGAPNGNAASQCCTNTGGGDINPLCPVPTPEPTPEPTAGPTHAPTPVPTGLPSPVPSVTQQPTLYTPKPSPAPTATTAPTVSLLPTTAQPSISPSLLPTSAPTHCSLGEIKHGDSGLCAPCEAGRYASNITWACEPCEAGLYQSSPGRAVCERCAPGELSSANRLYCAPCTSGQRTVSGVECQDCVPGRYAPTAQTDDCLICPPGRFAENSGASSCLDCEAEVGLGSGSVEGAAECRSCRVGYFHPGNHTAKKTGHQVCEACTRGLACDTPGLDMSTVILEPDYWRTSRSSLKIMGCQNDRCIGGVGAGNELCKEGHAGPRCGLCSPDYFNSITGACQPCEQTAVGLSLGLIVAALVFVVILWKCLVTRLGKWARRRVRAFGKTMFVFVQIVVTLPAIIRFPIPFIPEIKVFTEMHNWFQSKSAGKQTNAEKQTRHLSILKPSHIGSQAGVCGALEGPPNPGVGSYSGPTWIRMCCEHRPLAPTFGNDVFTSRVGPGGPGSARHRHLRVFRPLEEPAGSNFEGHWTSARDRVRGVSDQRRHDL